MIRVGITGSIATGKSTVTSYLIDKGYTVIDCDKISKDVLTINTNCINQVKKQFPSVVINGNINRQELAKLIFNNKQAKSSLERIIHPIVIDTINKETKLSDQNIIFYDIPLLFESKLEYLCDKIIVVYIDSETQLKRLQIRDCINQEYAKRKISNQIDIEKKKSLANYVLINDTKEHLYAQIENMLGELSHAKNDE